MKKFMNEFNTTLESGSVQLSPKEMGAMKKFAEMDSEEYVRQTLDAWREHMGLDQPIPDNIEAENITKHNAKDYLSGDEYRPTSRHDILTRLRHEMPFIPIMPFPQVTKCIICTGSVDVINLPDNTIMVKFSGDRTNGSNFLVDPSGSPLEFANSTTPGAQFTMGCMINPFDRYFYCLGNSQVSVIGPSGFPFVAECWQHTV